VFGEEVRAQARTRARQVDVISLISGSRTKGNELSLIFVGVREKRADAQPAHRKHRGAV